jgi:hypothetical protein
MVSESSAMARLKWIGTQLFCWSVGGLKSCGMGNVIKAAKKVEATFAESYEQAVGKRRGGWLQRSYS